LLTKNRFRNFLTKLFGQKEFFYFKLIYYYMLYQNILDLIGNTPLVKINNLNPNPKVNIYAKLEGQNPGGSVKDRIGLSMIQAAEKSGELTKNKTILEPTSGNTGIGLALVGVVKGYRVVLTMSAGMSEERKKMLKALGAKLVETDPLKGTDGAIMKAKEMFQENPKKYWMPYQFSNPNNPLAHFENTAEEIIKDLPNIDYFVAGIGTSGTLIGAGKKLKQYNSKIKIIGIEPQFAHKIAGLKNMKEAIVPEIYDETKLDKKIVVNNEDAYETARQLALKEGIFVGMSSGAAMFGAFEFAKEIQSGNMAVIMPDRGEKYLSTILFK
jgi:S-sulfo-L-cysteine synthase (O-acetyl-L-serine-dependent)